MQKSSPNFKFPNVYVLSRTRYAVAFLRQYLVQGKRDWYNTGTRTWAVFRNYCLYT